MEVIVTFQERYCLPMYSRESLQEVFREVGKILERHQVLLIIG